jgi:hypothetical protein
MIPHNNELQKKFAERGLVVVGVTNEPEKLVDKYIADNKVEYPIFIEKSFRSFGALKFHAYPSAVLIDPQGVVVWSGNPGGIDEATIEKALEGAHAPRAPLPPSLKAIQPLVAHKEFGKAHEAAKAMIGSGADEKAKAAAQKLVDSLEAEAKDLAAAADRAVESKHFYEAQDALDRLVKQYAGVPGAEGAAARLQALQADASAKPSIAAGAQLAKAADLEQGQDYDKAHAAYSAICASAPGSVPATEASARMKDLESRGMLGFDKKCNECNAQNKACAKHKKKK